LGDQFCYGKIGGQDFHEYSFFNVAPVVSSNGGVDVVFHSESSVRIAIYTRDGRKVTPFAEVGFGIISEYWDYAIRYRNCGTTPLIETSGDLIRLDTRSGFIEGIVKGEISEGNINGCYTAPEPFEFHFRYKAP
jgi:hypothetical protein